MRGNQIKVNSDIEVKKGEWSADYYIADLTQILTADLKTKDNLEKWTNDISSGDIRCACYPWFNIAKGDIIVIAADAQYKTEHFTHNEDFDPLWEIEVFELNDVILDSEGNKYYREEDFILVGFRFVHWISENKPKPGAVISIRYGYKPSFICFEDNPEPNNLENRRYPKIIYVKQWSKLTPEEITKLMNVEKI
jgi:hypothetical protein